MSDGRGALSERSPSRAAFTRSTNSSGATLAKAQMEPSAPASMEGSIKGSNPARTLKSGLTGLTSCSTSTVWVYWAVRAD